MQLVSIFNKCADVPDSSLSNNQTLQILGCHYSNAQIFGKVDSDKINLYFNSSDKCISWTNSKLSLGECTINPVFT